MAVRSITHHADQQNPHVISALGKLGAALPDLPASHIRHLTKRMREQPVDRGFVAVLDTITRGWCEARLVELWYGNSDKQTPGSSEFATYFVEVTPNGGVQATGFDTRTRQIHSLNLRRVVRARLLRSTFQPPTEFDPRPYLASLWPSLDETARTRHDVVLVFKSEVAAKIQQHSWNPLHPSQRIDTLADGRCRLHVRVDDWRKMLPWIRSWGSAVEALAPSELRRHLTEEAQQVVNQYRSNQAS
jgi:CRISPR-associated endonuclease/helicase Cas3